MIRSVLLPLLSVSLLLLSPSASAAPVVSNPAASQRTGTQLVDIAYDLDAPGFPTVSVRLWISGDGGTTWTVPSSSATGDIGADVEPGTGKAIVRYAGIDWPGRYSERERAEPGAPPHPSAARPTATSAPPRSIPALSASGWPAARSGRAIRR